MAWNTWQRLIHDELLVSVSREGVMVTLGHDLPPVELGYRQTAALASRLLTECDRLAALLESHGIDPASEPKR